MARDPDVAVRCLQHVGLAIQRRWRTGLGASDDQGRAADRAVHPVSVGAVIAMNDALMPFWNWRNSLRSASDPVVVAERGPASGDAPDQLLRLAVEVAVTVAHGDTADGGAEGDGLGRPALTVADMG